MLILLLIQAAVGFTPNLWANEHVSVFSKAPTYPATSQINVDEIVLSKTNIQIGYSKRYKEPSWVAYSLNPEKLRACFNRKDQFKPDPAISKPDSATLNDYKNSGYDRGHLSPAADNRWSNEAMKESFQLSNISPQPPNFNQRIWASLENLIRAWALQSKDLWVVTGPELSRVEKTIGSSEVGVSSVFYKALIAFSNDANQKPKAIAFRLPISAIDGSSQSSPLSSYTLSIRELERDSQIDFFEQAPAEFQESTELQLDNSDWDFSAKFSALPCATETPNLFEELFSR